MALRRFLNSKSRKTIHYALIICILLIQIILGVFIYGEFKNKKNIAFIESQLKEIDALEHFTDKSKKDFFKTQNYFQDFLASNDQKDLDAYLASMTTLGKRLDSIGNYQFKNPSLKGVINLDKAEIPESTRLKTIIDSTQNVTVSTPVAKSSIVIPEIPKYHFEYDVEDFDVKTETFKDTITKKKGLFGRLGDAISGKENVRKDSTVVTMKQAQANQRQKNKRLIDSLMNSADRYYSTQVKKVRVNVINKQKVGNSKKVDNHLALFGSMLVYSNQLMDFYDSAIKSGKAKMINELEKQKSSNDARRIDFAIGAMVLMFLVSLFIMYFTRLAFFYEEKLRLANIQAEENVKFKNRILGMLSHELRSPLKIIGIFINRINKKTSDDSIKEYLKSISFTNNTLLMQANQILEYTKNQQVENKLIPVNFNLRNEITAILTSIEPYVETRNNKFVVEENISPSINVYSDNTKINQVFMNIIGNANKFTENGQITVITKAKSINEKQVRLETEIKDTGAGISEADLKSIFEPYYQGVLSTEVENLGAGLGLSLCKELVELYGGEISVDSELGKGSCVRFTFNLDLQNEFNG